jgi:cellulose biosynthesis protein BcsQ
MSNIITFYSYKGGVGRSMALANIAYELAHCDKKVLMIDWDLEAPGLENYFSYFDIENDSDGLLQLFLSYQQNEFPNYNEFLWKIKTPNKIPLSLLHSGRAKNPKFYSKMLQEFNWDDFFKNKKGGIFLEELRTHWRKDFDFVLIDSRTGINDLSGICSIFMPDILIPLFSANFQSLFGIRELITNIQVARQNLNIDRMALTVLPIPSRFGTRVEFRESQEWLDRMSDILKDFYTDWLPKWIEPRYILEQVKIPQVDYFSFGEKLAVHEQGINDPESMGFIYSKIAELLASNFKDLETFIGKDYYLLKKKDYEKMRVVENEKFQSEEKTHDVFISFTQENYEWVKELLVPALSEYMNGDLDYEPKIFWNIGSIGEDELNRNIKRSKSYIIILSNQYFLNKYSSYELDLIMDLGANKRRNLIFPIMIENSQEYRNIESYIKNNTFKKKQVMDFSMFKLDETLRSTKLRSLFGKEVEKLSKLISFYIKEDKNIIIDEKPYDSKNELEKLKNLATEYENIRKQMKSGNERTKLMTNIFKKMVDVSIDLTTNLRYMTNSNSPGERLAAIAKLNKYPNKNYLNWLADRIGYFEKPFVGYQASVALYKAARLFGNSDKNFENILKIAQENIKKGVYEDLNQIDIIESTYLLLDLVSPAKQKTRKK